MRILLALLISVASCSRADPPPSTRSTGTAKDPIAAKASIARGAVVIDVREPDELAAGRLPAAVNIPVREVGARITDVDRLVGGDRTRPIVIYCRTGNRSGKAKSTLEAAGFSQVINGGGIDDLL